MDAQEIFEQRGMHFDDAEEAMNELTALESDELWDLTEQFIGEDNVIGVEGSEEMQANTLRIALVNALEANAERITQKDIDLAQERALDLEADTDAEAETTPIKVTAEAESEETEAEAEASADEQPAKRTRKRTSVSRELIRSLIKADPDAPREDILEQAFDQGADVAETTAVMYFYDARKELGLEPNGKRGRKPTNSIEKVRELIEANWDMERGDLIDLIVSELEYKPNTATVYYHEALNEINEDYGYAA